MNRMNVEGDGAVSVAYGARLGQARARVLAEADPRGDAAPQAGAERRRGAWYAPRINHTTGTAHAPRFPTCPELVEGPNGQTPDKGGRGEEEARHPFPGNGLARRIPAIGPA